jgi:transcriptional regulator with XRE-family HTH domain
MASLKENLAANLKRLRLKKKLSQEALAKKASISISYVSEIERGNRSPALETVDELGKALEIPPLRLLSNP